ncbi:hypothetical protein ACC848_37970 [Rhizobium johnstonii]
MSQKQTLANRSNALERHKGAGHPDTIDAKRAHAAAAIAEEIERRLASVPPLTEAQVARLSGLLRGASR